MKKFKISQALKARKSLKGNWSYVLNLKYKRRTIIANSQVLDHILLIFLIFGATFIFVKSGFPDHYLEKMRGKMAPYSERFYL